MESNAGRDGLYTASASHAVSTAKLHILQLEPIKEKLGDRWSRLSDLVHKLFEKTLKPKKRLLTHLSRQNNFLKITVTQLILFLSYKPPLQIYLG